MGRQFGGVAKLETNLTGGGTCLWVPKDERELETLNAERNGTYRPTKYGFSRANVRVPSQSGGVTGKGQDGNEYTVTVDDGELVKTKIPSSIVIVTEPTVTEYEDGDAINFSGIVVKAYDGEGNLWTDAMHPDGVIPYSELRFPDTVAVYTGGGSGYDNTYVSPSGQIQVGSGTITGPIIAMDRLILTSPSVNPYSLLTEAFLIERNQWWYTIFVNQSMPGGIDCRVAAIGEKLYIARSENFDCSQYMILEDGTVIGAGTVGSTESFTLEGKTVYYIEFTPVHFAGERDFSFIVPESTQASGQAKRICWYMIYGEMEYQGTSEQEVPVDWPRPGDGKVLRDEFTIEVSPADSGGNTGGNTGGGTGGGEGEGGGGGGHAF